jgi:SpoVK/Ycf46/Vps4 family AAA+-type ATPase
LVSLVLREAKLHGAIPYLESADHLDKDELSRVLGNFGGIVLLGSSQMLALSADKNRVITVDLPALNFEQQRECWKRALQKRSVQISDATLDSLAERMRLNPEQISEAAALGCSQARWRSALASSALETHRQPPVALEDLYAAARVQTGSELPAVATKLRTTYTWDDLVVPETTFAQLREFCTRIVHREQVLKRWGFDRKLSFGKGTTALFAGPSGTGKTMAAEVIANEVRLDLYKIDLAGVVSKYIGETEKNLDRIFAAAQGTNTILLFDEADALFGKRSEVRDSHDRYANLEISYLLQKMDSYEGSAILTSNLRHHLDDAFVRRLAFHVHFPFPEPEYRGHLWRKVWPIETPLADGVDLDYLSERFRLSGGNIKNVALAAAFLASADGGRVQMSHLLRAVEREFGKMGKIVNCVETGSETPAVVLTQ